MSLKNNYSVSEFICSFVILSFKEIYVLLLLCLIKTVTLSQTLTSQ